MNLFVRASFHPAFWLRGTDVWPFSVEQVVPPLIVALAEKSHQVTARVQTEGARSASQTHPCFLRRTASLPVITGVAAGHEVLPSGFAGARARHYVVQS